MEFYPSGKHRELSHFASTFAETVEPTQEVTTTPSTDHYSRKSHDMYDFRTINGTKMLQCRVCENISYNETCFLKHFGIKHARYVDNSKPLDCCGFTMISDEEKLKHIDVYHKYGYSCADCPKVFPTKDYLQQHFVTHYGKVTYKCSLCSYQVPFKQNVKTHIRRHHSIDAKGCIVFLAENGQQIQTEQCGNDRVSSHVAGDAIPEVITTPITNYYSKRPDNMYDFVVINGVSMVQCRICGYLADNEPNFRNHFVKKHSKHLDKSKPLECCGLTIASDEEKSAHINGYHTDGFPCTACLKVFPNNEYQQQHLWTHYREVTFKCSLCSYRAAVKHSVKRHIKAKHSIDEMGFIVFLAENGQQIQTEEVVYENVSRKRKQLQQSEL